MTLPTGKIDLNEYGNHLAEKSSEIYEERGKRVTQRLDNLREEALSRAGKWQTVLDRSDELLKEQKERKRDQEIERLTEEKRKEVDREVSQRLSMPDEHQQKLNKGMSEMLKDLF